MTSSALLPPTATVLPLLRLLRLLLSLLLPLEAPRPQLPCRTPTNTHAPSTRAPRNLLVMVLPTMALLVLLRVLAWGGRVMPTTTVVSATTTPSLPTYLPTVTLLLGLVLLSQAHGHPRLWAHSHPLLAHGHPLLAHGHPL